MSESTNREREIFNEALEIESLEARAAYLLNACGPDHELQERVEALLAGHEAAPGFIPDRVALTEEGQSGAGRPCFAEQPGDLVGRYKLLEKIGEGGMGVVYLAEQQEPIKRQVALKIIKVGMDTRQVVARFEAERQALARMDHPHIAKVLDGGETSSGRPYFVMELVPGVPITRFCDEERLDTCQRLNLFAQVCSAVQHAHQKGVIHRDLKPSNVLVTRRAEGPMPKVIDFGLAKSTQEPLTDKTVLTRMAQFLGTPAYMSPEQASLSGVDIDTRTDIYALGVLLYELLTGKRPFDTKALLSIGYEEVLRVIREVEPQAPSKRLSTLQDQELTTTAEQRRAEPHKLALLVRGDLDWIVMKALEKDRARRYETANALASDIRRHLDNEPVVARPPSAAYRLGKAVRRNKLAFAAAGGVMAALVIGTVVSLWQADRARLALGREAKARAGESRLAYARTIALAQQAWSDGMGYRAEPLLLSCPVELQNWEYHYLQRLCNWEALAYTGHTFTVRSVAFLPDGQSVASADDDGQIHLWDRQTGRLLRKCKIDGGFAYEFSPDGKRLASWKNHRIQVWDVSSGAALQTLDTNRFSIFSVAFSPDGLLLVAAGSEGQYPFEAGSIKVWDCTTGDLLLQIPTRFLAGAAEFSPDGRFIAGGTRGALISPVEPGELKVWEVKSGKEILDLSGHTSITTVAFSKDSRWLAAGGSDGFARVWDLTTGREFRTFFWELQRD